jgi:hypothetical protein
MTAARIVDGTEDIVRAYAAPAETAEDSALRMTIAMFG